MPRRTPATTTGLAGLISVLVAAVLIWLFAPTTLGGTFSYVVVNGNSMSPRLVTGDLVLLRAQGDYSVGDAVTYRHPQLGPVLHRIVADDGERFTMRGDNRAGDDGYLPTRGDVIGREWLAIPNGGRVVRELQSTRNITLLIGSAILLGIAGGVSTSGGRRLGRRVTGFRPSGAPRRLGAVRTRRDFSVYSQFGRQALLGGLALGAGSLTLFVLYADRGATEETTEPVAYTERGAFSYGGQIAGGVYDDDELTAPQPLYRQLSNDLPLSFSYDLSAADAVIENVLGTVELVAVVGSEDGWSRTFPLRPETRFASDEIEIDTTLDLSALEGELLEIAERTGVATNRYVLEVVATVEAAGVVDGLPFESSYEHAANFRLGELQLLFDGNPEALALTEERSVNRPTSTDRALDVPMLPLSLQYSQIPLVATLGAAAATVILFVVARATLITRRRGEAARIRAAYSMLLVEVAQAAAIGAEPDDVDQFADLVRLANAEGLAIMHRSGPRDDEYVVNASDRSWRYAVPKREREDALTALPTPIHGSLGVRGGYITTNEG